MKHPTRVGIAGLGQIAPYHLRSIEGRPDLFTLAAACDPVAATRDPLRVPVHDDVTAMLDGAEVDAVVVATPPSMHATIASEALSRGIDVLLEKPPTLSRAEFADLELAADATGALLWSAFHFASARELRWFEDHRAEIEAELGPPCAAKAGFYDPYVKEGLVEAHAAGLHGSWADSGPNALSVLASLVGTYSPVLRRVTLMSGYDHDVAAECTLGFEGRYGSCGQAVITTNWCLGISHKSTLLAYASSCCLVHIDHSLESVSLRDRHGSWRVLFSTASPEHHLQAHYDGVYSEFSKAIATRADNRAATRRLLDALWGEPSGAL